MPEQIPTSLDALIELETPSGARLSPDGKWIAYVTDKPDWKENGYVGQIHLIENKVGARPRQLTFSKGGSTNPIWSADGQSLAFLSKREGDAGWQIYRLSVLGGEAERLTEFAGSVSNIQYAPNGSGIAFVATPPETEKEKGRKEKFGSYVEDNVDYKRSQLWLLVLADKKVYQLTADEQFHIRDYRWHPDSDKVAIVAMPTPDMGTLLETRIYLLELGSLAVRPLTLLRTNIPRWSPDGRWLVYERGVYEEEAGAFYMNGHLEMIALEDGEIRPLEMDFDEDVSPVAWSPEGIYFTAVQRMSVQLFCVRPETGRVTQMTPAEYDGLLAADYSFSADYGQAATVCADSDTFWEVAVLDVSAKALTRLTTYNEATAAWKLPKHEVYSWHSHDGTEIEGVLTRPLDFDPQKKYPLLVVIHGGPAAVSFRMRCGRYERHFYPIYQWVAQGAIVLQPNYRGSTGYGEAFRGLNVRDLGMGDYADVISGVDALIAEGWVDSEAVGAMGWSQGGYISAFITCFSDRFKAVSVGAGISNWVTYYVNTDIHPFTRIYLKDTPWDDPEIYAKTSPMTYIKEAQTPTLIQHGGSDSRVPVANAYELYQGLLDQGVESKLVVYPGMPHGPTKPKQVRHILTDNLNWFNRHVFGMAGEAAERPTLYVIVPPVDVENPAVSKVYHLLRPEEALCRFLDGEGRLLDAPPEESGRFALEQTQAIAQQIAAQLAGMGTKKVVVFTPPTDKHPEGLVALGCVQIAAGSVGGIDVVHRPIG